MASSADYRVQPRPAAVEPLGAWFRWRSDLVDYSRHEAYADLVRKAGLGRRAAALAAYSGRFALLAAKRLLRYEMIPTEYREGRSPKAWLGFAAAAAKNALSPARLMRRRPAPPVNDVQAGLQAGGVAVVVMPPGRLAELQALAAPYFERLRA